MHLKLQPLLRMRLLLQLRLQRLNGGHGSSRQQWCRIGWLGQARYHHRHRLPAAIRHLQRGGSLGGPTPRRRSSRYGSRVLLLLLLLEQLVPAELLLVMQDRHRRRQIRPPRRRLGAGG